MVSNNNYAGFIHLRVHTTFSLSEGLIRSKDLKKFCNKYKVPAVAITDTNSMFGVREFSEKLSSLEKDGDKTVYPIQPIIGIQLDVNYNIVNNKEIVTVSKVSVAPVVILARNEVGYQNLLKLKNCAYDKIYEYKQPFVTIDELEKYNEGLIFLTGGAKGIIGKLILENRIQEAYELARKLLYIYQDRVYIEIQRHYLKEEEDTEEVFLNIALELNIPIVATNDVSYLSPDQFEAANVLLAISEGVVLDLATRKTTPDHYLKSPEDMISLFSDLPEAIENTVLIARKCGFFVEKKSPELPHYETSEDRDEISELRYNAEIGLQNRLNTIVYNYKHIDINKIKEQVKKEYEGRLEFELNIISQMGFSGYFLIVADFIGWAKRNNVPVGPGRGSGAGSIVAWSLDITDIDPIRFGLLFERFLNPERLSMPDFDIDFCQDRRDEVIKYVQRKYGADRVAHIITFGSLQARGVVKDVGRVLGINYSRTDQMSKLIPAIPGKNISLQKAITDIEELKQLIKKDEELERVAQIGLVLEGANRHASLHAAGIVIGARPLNEIVPIYRDEKSPMLVAGFSMKYVEDTGLVKFDFLGLKNLSVILKCIEYIKIHNDINIELSTLPLDDKKTFELLTSGFTVGVFQLESPGMRNVLRKMRPDQFEDIIAVISLYRPGPMDNIASYIQRKHGIEEPDYMHESITNILKETFGIMIYQEQVMQIAQSMGGYSLGAADLLRRAMGKKLPEEMRQQKELFMAGALNNNINASIAEYVFDQMEKFAGYGFNKSHAAAYALISYYTAYLKAHYQEEYLAAFMSLDIDSTDRISVFIREAKDLEIHVLLPDINKSKNLFDVEIFEDKKAIRYSLAALKGIGSDIVQKIQEEREKSGEYKDIFDFFKRTAALKINKRMLENMIKAGAFDSIYPNRNELIQNLDIMIGFAVSENNNSNGGKVIQEGLFGGETPKPVLNNYKDFTSAQRLEEECNAVGFYLTEHPTERWKSNLKTMGIKSFVEHLNNMKHDKIKLAGAFVNIRRFKTSDGAFVTFSDYSGIFEATISGAELTKFRSQLESGKVLIIDLVVQTHGDDFKLRINNIVILEDILQSKLKGVEIYIDTVENCKNVIELINKTSYGTAEIILCAKVDSNCYISYHLKKKFKVNSDFKEELIKLGIEKVIEII